MSIDPFRVPADALVVVVGGANLDTVGFSENALAMNDSNPGQVRSNPGGVGRNIAENIARLGVRVELVTAVGSDEASRDLVARTRATGVGMDAAVVAFDVPCARYLAINDERHELVVAINDMRALEALTPECLAEEPRVGLLAAADLVVVDANVSVATIEAIPSLTHAPLLLDPVSSPKAPRFEGILSRAAAIKPNGHEAAALLGYAVETLDDAQAAARELVARGVGAAFVTPAERGVGWADARGSGCFDLPATYVANSIGAGDSYVGGLAYAMLAGVDTVQAARFASACSAITLGSVDSVSEEMTRERALATMKEMYR